VHFSRSSPSNSWWQTMAGWQVLSRPSAAEGGGRRPAFTGLATRPYSATEVDGWQHKLSRVSQNRAAVQPDTLRHSLVCRPTCIWVRLRPVRPSGIQPGNCADEARLGNNPRAWRSMCGSAFNSRRAAAAAARSSSGRPRSAVTRRSQGPDGRRPSATARNSAPPGQLPQGNTSPSDMKPAFMASLVAGSGPRPCTKAESILARRPTSRAIGLQLKIVATSSRIRRRSDGDGRSTERVCAAGWARRSRNVLLRKRRRSHPL
jgi:hypothetical protein